MLWKTYGKAVLALVFAAVFALQAALVDGHVTSTEGVQITIAVATAAGVVLVPIHPDWPWMKTAVAVLLAGLNVVVTVIAHGITMSDWTVIALAVLTALGVGAAPAASRLRNGTVRAGAGPYPRL